MEKLQEELAQLKKQYDQTNKQKIEKKLEKQKVDDKQEELEKQLNILEEKKKKVQENLKEQQTHFKEEMLELAIKNDELKDELVELQQKLDESENKCRKYKDVLMINSQLPPKNINFKETLPSGVNKSDDEPMDITYTCCTVGHPFILGNGQALLTFEDAQVAESVIAKKRHSLDINGTRATVDAVEPVLNKSVKFEVCMNISSKKVKIFNLPKDIPEEILKDKVELTFYKSGIGGAEIEEVEYDRNDNTAYVTYLQNGVAQRVLKRDRHQFVAGKVKCEVKVMPCTDIELNKLQMFTANSARSVLLTGIKNVDDQEEDDVQDAIQVHFQKESNGGGEVEKTVFSMDGKKTVIFEDDLI